MLKFKGDDWSKTQQELVTQDSLPVLHPPWNTFFFEGQGKKLPGQSNALCLWFCEMEQSSSPGVRWKHQVHFIQGQ